MVWYWLKYDSKKGSVLIVDEPELNLHPLNQRRFARFLVELVNNGVKVFITTHSDYIVKEFNTLIMLKGLSEDNLNLFVKKHKSYKISDVLDVSKISLYITGREVKKHQKTKLTVCTKLI